MDLSKKRKSADDLEHTAKRLNVPSAAVESVPRNQQPETAIINISDDEDNVMSGEEYYKYLADNVEYVVGGGEEDIHSSAIELQCVSVCDENEDPDYHVLSDDENEDEDEEEEYHVLSDGEYDQRLYPDDENEDDDYHVMSDEEYYKYLAENVEYVVGGE